MIACETKEMFFLLLLRSFFLRIMVVRLKILPVLSFILFLIFRTQYIVVEQQDRNGNRSDNMQ